MVQRDEVRLIVPVHRENQAHVKLNYFHGNAACLINGCDSRPNFKPKLGELEAMVVDNDIGSNPEGHDQVLQELVDVLDDFMAIRGETENDRRRRQAETRAFNARGRGAGRGRGRGAPAAQRRRLNEFLF
jgi:hypothetical protein